MDAVVPAAAVATLATATAIHAGPAVWSTSVRGRRRLGIRDRLDDGDAVALTFDDGPHPLATPVVLDILREAQARATFFLVGEQVERYPALAAEIAAAGHAVGLHGNRHRGLLRLTPRQVRADLLRARDRIAEATGHGPSLYRPPYGVLSGAALSVAHREGWRPVLWTRVGRDWRAAASPASVAAEAAGGLRGGEILLLHDADHYGARDCWRATTGALPLILDSLAVAGLRPALVS